MSKQIVDLSHVCAVLQGRKILDNISFNIQAGGHLAIIGKSGSGKSALLNVIAGTQGINGGTITYNLNNAKSGSSEILVPQKIAFISARHHFKSFSGTSDFYYQQRYNSSEAGDALTVIQYLASLVRSNANYYWDMNRVINKLKLEELCDKQIIKLSNGETKRLRIAAALIRNPVLLLLDQPFTGLDADSRKYFNELLKEIAASGITVVMATLPAEIPDIIAQVNVLEEGRLTNTFNAAEMPDKKFDWVQASSQLNEQAIATLLTDAEDQKFEWIIKMRGANVRYGDKAVLKNINWQVRQGERWALSGPNGSGKSTLLSLVYGDNPQAYSNDIILFDKPRGTGESIWDIKRKCGFVSPELFQYFPMANSCLQVIESGFYDTLGLFRVSDPSRAALALRWMKVFNIENYARMATKNIPVSAQRLCLLARALIKNPALLILDEPCQAMDAEQQLLFKQIIDLICQKSNITLIYVTHYEAEIPGAVKNFLRLQNGEIACMQTVSS